MTVTVNPQYTEWEATWQKMRDCISQDAVKAAGNRYLPWTAGMLKREEDETGVGLRAYNSYKKRARFDPALATIVEDSLGLAFAEPWTIVVPEALEPFVESATPDGASLQVALRDTVSEQLIVGRDGILRDWTGGPSPESYAVKYPAESIVNWVDHLDTDTGEMVLDRVDLLESATLWIGGQWTEEATYRVLIMEDGEYTVYAGLDENEMDTLPEDKRAEMRFAGQPILKIPFYFAGVKNYTADVEQPPNLKAANISLAKYIASADYGQALFMQGQGTFAGTGLTVEDQKKIDLLGAEGTVFSTEADAKLFFVELAGVGLTEMRLDQENFARQLEECGVSLPVESSQESGRALQMRLTSKTAGLKMINLTAAAVYERLLKDMGEQMGLGEKELDRIVVKPYLGFGDQIVTRADARSTLDAHSAGAPIPMEAVHADYKLAGVSMLDDFEKDRDTRDAEAPTGMEAVE